MDNNESGFFDVIISKLKEQSFVILLMLGVIYYQHTLMEERVSYWQKQCAERDAYIQQTTKDEKSILIERIKYLQDERDKYVEGLLSELKDIK